jgi:putative ABC transport system permease protein
MWLLRDFRTDVACSIRMLCRMPGFTFVAVLSLALGIGANTAIFSLINTLMLRTLAASHPEQLVVLFSVYPGEPRADCCFTPTTYRHFLENNHVFSELIAAAPSVLNVIFEGRDVDGPSADAEFVGSNYFSALG